MITLERMWAPCRELNPTHWAVTNNRSEEKRISWVKECNDLFHFLSALVWFHGPDKYHGEKEDMDRERVSAVGMKPKKPWELFTDTSLRWQLLTLFVIHTSQQLNGINAVCISPRHQETTTSHQWFSPPPLAAMWLVCGGLDLDLFSDEMVIKV